MERSGATSLSAPVLKGIVAWFDSGRGFGFIEAEGGKTFFAHEPRDRAPSVEPWLRLGEAVEFEPRAGSPTPRAVNVRRVSQ